MKTPIKRIVLDLGGGAEVELSLEQAKQLWATLNDFVESQDVGLLTFGIGNSATSFYTPASAAVLIRTGADAQPPETVCDSGSLR